MSSTKVKNQHYIAQCILEKFAINSKVFESLVVSGKIYPTNYRNAMSERFIYEHPSIDTNKLESTFAKIEGDFSQELDRMLILIDRIENGDIDIEELKIAMFENMKIFIIFYYRSGAVLHEYIFDKVPKQDRVIPLLNKILDNTYIEKLCLMLSECYNFAVLKSKGDFLLSDQYVSTAALSIKNRFMDMSNRHMGMKDTLILLPLSSSYYIVLFTGKYPEFISKNSIISLDKKSVNEINTTIINNSYRKCIGQNINAIQAVSGNYEDAPPSKIVSGGANGVYVANNKKEVFFYSEDYEKWNFFIEHDWIKYNRLRRNDICLCGSDKKFKNCCLDKYNNAKRMMDEIGHGNIEMYRINGRNIIEKSINSFKGR